MAPHDTEVGATVAFEISEDQYDQLRKLLAALRADPGERAVVSELTDLILDLTDTGLSYFFLYSLESIGVGALRRKGAEIALGTAGRVLPPVVRSTVGSMTEDQLLKLADFIEHMVSEQVQDP
jgi:hypothetical protein